MLYAARLLLSIELPHDTWPFGSSRVKNIALQPNQVVPQVDLEGDNAVDGIGAHTADGGGPVLACVEVAPSIGAPFALASVSSAGAGGAGAPAATGGPLFDQFDDALGGLGALGC